MRRWSRYALPIHPTLACVETLVLAGCKVGVIPVVSTLIAPLAALHDTIAADSIETGAIGSTGTRATDRISIIADLSFRTPNPIAAH